MNTFDYGYILQLADFISLSSAAAKEAAKALRREFKVRGLRRVVRRGGSGN